MFLTCVLLHTQASWANFAKYNNPTPNNILNQFLWKPVDRVQFQYLSVNATNQTNIMHYEYKQKQSQFWNAYIYKLVGYRPQYWPNVFEPLHEELRIYRTFTWAILIILVIMVFLTVFCGCLYCRAIRLVIEMLDDSSMNLFKNFPVEFYLGVCFLFVRSDDKLTNQTFTPSSSDRVGDANLGFVDLVATGTQYTAPSSKANSELDLNIRSNTSIKETMFPMSNGTNKYNNRYAYNRVAGSQF